MIKLIISGVFFLIHKPHLSLCLKDKCTPYLGFLHNKCLSILSGTFKYRFTIPGVYYYSSGYIDDANVKVLQGVVKVLPREDESREITVSVSGVEARLVPEGRYTWLMKASCFEHVTPCHNGWNHLPRRQVLAGSPDPSPSASPPHSAVRATRRILFSSPPPAPLPPSTPSLPTREPTTKSSTFRAAASAPLPVPMRWAAF